MPRTFPRSDFAAAPTGPLVGLRVVDLSRLVAGNMTSLQLADFGADVVKVEPLPTGDPLRAWRQKGQQTFWKTYARNKRSLALDFRSDGALEVLRDLAAGADVMIESFRPGTFEGMGFGPDVIARDFPRLILLRVSGFGQDGPYSPRPGFGTLVEAMSGFASRNGEEGGDPLLPPLALADMIAGLYGANAVMMALRARDASGRGQIVDLALLDAMTSVLGPEPADYRLTGTPKPRLGNGSNTSSPRNVYRSRDGGFVAISASIQRAAERLFKVIGREDMNTDPRYATNEARVARRTEVDGIVGGWIGARDRDEVLRIFTENGITAAPIYDVADLVEDEHFVERGIFVEVPDRDLGTMPTHAPLPRLSGTPGNLWRPAPRLGEHTRQVLADYAVAPERADALLASGTVLAAGETPA